MRSSSCPRCSPRSAKEKRPGRRWKRPSRSCVPCKRPAGCGKTTTLRMIAGLEEVTSGDIRIGGRSVTHLPPRDRDIAMVFQSYALYPHMNVFRNMAFSLQLRGMSKPDIAARVGEVSDILGLRELLERKPRQLSGGQRQRVAVGAALCRQ